MIKRYIIRKYVLANSLQDACKKEKLQKVDEAWIDDKWEFPTTKEQTGFK